MIASQKIRSPSSAERASLERSSKRGIFCSVIIETQGRNAHVCSYRYSRQRPETVSIRQMEDDREMVRPVSDFSEPYPGQSSGNILRHAASVRGRESPSKSASRIPRLHGPDAGTEDASQKEPPCC